MYILSTISLIRLAEDKIYPFICPNRHESKLTNIAHSYFLIQRFIAHNYESLLLVRDTNTIDLYDLKTYVLITSIRLGEIIQHVIGYYDALLIITEKGIYQVSNAGIIRLVDNYIFSVEVKVYFTADCLYLVDREKYHKLDLDNGIIKVAYSVFNPDHTIAGYNKYYNGYITEMDYVTFNYHISEADVKFKGKHYNVSKPLKYNLGIGIATSSDEIYHASIEKHEVKTSFITKYERYKVAISRFLVYTSISKVLKIYDLQQHIITDSLSFEDEILDIKLILHGFVIVTPELTYSYNIGLKGQGVLNTCYRTDIVISMFSLPWFNAKHQTIEGFEDLMIKALN